MRRDDLPLWLSAMSIGVLALALGNPISDYDPAQYAEVARRIARSGDWLHLFDNYGPFLNKPPLAMWLMAVPIKVLGPTSVAARLPTLLCGVVLLVATWQVGKELWDETTGRWAAALLGASVAFYLMVLDPKVDMVLTCTTALAVWMGVLARRRQHFVWPMWAFAALGVLTKGPIGLVIPAAALVPEALRQGFGPRSSQPPPGVVGRVLYFRPLGGLVVVALVVVPFYLAALEQHGADGLKFLLWGQSFDRVLHRSDYRNSTTPLFYAHTALWAFLPFWPALVVALGRRLKALWEARTLRPEASRIVLWWLALPWIAIAASEFRLPQYLYWLAPPSALLAARELVGATGRTAKWLSGFAVAVAGIAVAAVLGLQSWAFPPQTWLGRAWALAPAAALAAAFVAFRHGAGAGRAALPVAVSMLGALAYLALGFHPALLAYQPSEQLAREVRRLEPQAKVLHLVDLSGTHSLPYYLDRRVEDIDVGNFAVLVRTGQAHLAVIGAEREPILRAAGIDAERVLTVPTFPVSRPSARFLAAATREAAVARWTLVRVKPL